MPRYCKFKNTRRTFDTPEKIALAVTKHEAGFTYEEIGTVFGVSKVTIKNLFKGLELKTRSYSEVRRLTKYTERTIALCYDDYYINNLSFEALAKKHGICDVTIRKIFKERSWGKKTRAEWATFYSGDKSAGKKAVFNRLKTGRYRNTSLDGYQSLVSYITKLVYCNHVKHIRPKEPAEQSIDHIYSVAAAYYDKEHNFVTVKELCHPVNLRIVSKVENSKKGQKSLISADELRYRISHFNATWGDPMEFIADQGVDLDILSWEAEKLRGKVQTK